MVFTPSAGRSFAAPLGRPHAEWVKCRSGRGHHPLRVMLRPGRARTSAVPVHVPNRLRKKPAPTPPRFELGPAEAGELTTVFAPPRWLRGLGRMSWLLLGFLLLLGVLGWILATTNTIVGPVIAGTIVATVTGPAVGRLARHMPRAAAAGPALLGIG